MENPLPHQRPSWSLSYPDSIIRTYTAQRTAKQVASSRAPLFLQMPGREAPGAPIAGSARSSLRPRCSVASSPPSWPLLTSSRPPHIVLVMSLFAGRMIGSLWRLGPWSRCSQAGAAVRGALFCGNGSSGRIKPLARLRITHPRPRSPVQNGSLVSELRPRGSLARSTGPARGPAAKRVQDGKRAGWISLGVCGGRFSALARDVVPRGTSRDSTRSTRSTRLRLDGSSPCTWPPRAVGPPSLARRDEDADAQAKLCGGLSSCPAAPPCQRLSSGRRKH